MLLSVTEGEDKPLKYPTIFNTADVAVVTKMDLAEAVEFDGRRRAQYSDGPAGMRVIKVSAKTGEGLQECMELFSALRPNANTTANR